jgi:hypothetical protein
MQSSQLPRCRAIVSASVQRPRRSAWRLGPPRSTCRRCSRRRSGGSGMNAIVVRGTLSARSGTVTGTGQMLVAVRPRRGPPRRTRRAHTQPAAGRRLSAQRESPRRGARSPSVRAAQAARSSSPAHPRGLVVTAPCAQRILPDRISLFREITRAVPTPPGPFAKPTATNAFGPRGFKAPYD